MTLTPRTKLAAYLAIVVVVSWSIAFTFVAVGDEWGSPLSQAVALLFMMPPAFAALIVKGPIAGDPILQELGLKLKLNRWLFLSWLLPVAIWGLALLIAGLLPGVSYAFSVDAFLEYYRPSLGEQFSEFETQVRSFHQEYGVHPVVRMLLQALVAGVTLNAFRGLGEELGWRGLMHHELGVLGASFWHRSLVTGLAWGIWYSPLLVLGLWYRDPTFAAIPMGIAWCIAASALLGYVRDKSGSIYAPAVLYGSLEGMSKLPPLSQGGTDLLVGVHGLAGIVALTAVLFGLLAIDRRRAMRASETVG